MWCYSGRVWSAHVLDDRLGKTRYIVYRNKTMKIHEAEHWLVRHPPNGRDQLSLFRVSPLNSLLDYHESNATEYGKASIRPTFHRSVYLRTAHPVAHNTSHE